MTNIAIVDARVDWTSVAVTDISQFEFKKLRMEECGVFRILSLDPRFQLPVF